jgi:hypothetical protein
LPADLTCGECGRVFRASDDGETVELASNPAADG